MTNLFTMQSVEQLARLTEQLKTNPELNLPRIIEWVEKLRSGSYHQCRGHLHIHADESKHKPARYCCLGIELLMIELPAMYIPKHGIMAGAFMNAWEDTNGQSYGTGKPSNEGHHLALGVTSDATLKWLNKLADKNDNGWSFARIAVFIEWYFGLSDDCAHESEHEGQHDAANTEVALSR